MGKKRRGKNPRNNNKNHGPAKSRAGGRGNRRNNSGDNGGENKEPEPNDNAHEHNDDNSNNNNNNNNNQNNWKEQQRQKKQRAKGKGQRGGPRGGSELQGVTGLNNIGNTCFFNSVLQNLAQTAALRNHFLTPEQINDPTAPPTKTLEGRFAKVLRQTMEGMWGSQNIHNPSQLLAIIGKDHAIFRKRRQQDAEELLRKLLESWSKDDEGAFKVISHLNETLLARVQSSSDGSASSADAIVPSQADAGDGVGEETELSSAENTFETADAVKEKVKDEPSPVTAELDDEKPEELGNAVDQKPIGEVPELDLSKEELADEGPSEDGSALEADAVTEEDEVGEEPSSPSSSPRSKSPAKPSTLQQLESTKNYLRLRKERGDLDLANYLFGGSLLSIVTCHYCHYESQKIDPILDLKADIPSTQAHYVNRETIPLAYQQSKKKTKAQLVKEKRLAERQYESLNRGDDEVDDDVEKTDDGADDIGGDDLGTGYRKRGRKKGNARQRKRAQLQRAAKAAEELAAAEAAPPTLSQTSLPGVDPSEGDLSAKLISEGDEAATQKVTITEAESEQSELVQEAEVIEVVEENEVKVASADDETKEDNTEISVEKEEEAQPLLIDVVESVADDANKKVDEEGAAIEGVEVEVVENSEVSATVDPEEIKEESVEEGHDEEVEVKETGADTDTVSHSVSKKVNRLENKESLRDFLMTTDTETEEEKQLLLRNYIDQRVTTPSPFHGGAIDLDDCLSHSTAPEVLSDFGCYSCTRRAFLRAGMPLEGLLEYYGEEEEDYQKFIQRRVLLLDGEEDHSTSETSTQLEEPHHHEEESSSPDADAGSVEEADTEPEAETEIDSEETALTITETDAGQFLSPPSDLHDAQADFVSILSSSPRSADTSSPLSKETEASPVESSSTVAPAPSTRTPSDIEAASSSATAPSLLSPVEVDLEGLTCIGFKPSLIQRPVSKQLCLHALPLCLTIHLKRFHSDYTGIRLRKNSDSVEFPLHLDVSPYLSRHSTIGSVSTMYRLYGVCSHSGSINGGHYIAVVQHLEADGTRGEWYHYSDTRVSQASERNALNTEAYLLFYERI